MSERCPATTRHIPQYGTSEVGVQCKFARGHEGDHAGHSGSGEGDVFWPSDPHADDQAGDEDRIREAMTEAQEHPGRLITR